MALSGTGGLHVMRWHRILSQLLKKAPGALAQHLKRREEGLHSFRTCKMAT